MYIVHVIYKWNENKNKKLKEERYISFQQIIIAINNDHAIDVIENPTYKGELMYVIKLPDYIYIVPFVNHGEYIELKTIYRSRKYKKIYGDKNG